MCRLTPRAPVGDRHEVHAHDTTFLYRHGALHRLQLHRLQRAAERRGKDAADFFAHSA